MRLSTVRLLIALVCVTTIAFVGTFSFGTSTASAQSAVVGSADFRNAPTLPPGTYTDRIVTGDTAWYSLTYTNNTPYRFEVSIPGVDLDSASELTLNASFVAPTLAVINGPAPTLTASGANYANGQTNLWFLKVSLESSGQQGLEYPILITVEGVLDAGQQPCAEVPGCTYDHDLAELDIELSEFQAELDRQQAVERSDAIRAEIENLGGFYETAEALRPAAEARLLRAEDRMAALCAPDITCTTFPEPAGKSPLLGLVVGGLALIIGAFTAFKKLTTSDEDDLPPKSRPRSSTEADARAAARSQ